MKTVVVLQSNYLPWKGYFDLVNLADLFVFYDDVQYSPQNWRNRNRIKTPQGAAWIVVPVGQKRHRRQCDVTINQQAWRRKHLYALQSAYGRAPFFRRYLPFFEEIYGRPWSTLSELNQTLIRRIAREFLGSTTEFADSRDFSLTGAKQERLLDLLDQVGADRYVSGPAARAYLSDEAFREAGVDLVYFSYEGYPEYPQRFPPFIHEVSIVDMLFNLGPEATRFMKTFGETSS